MVPVVEVDIAIDEKLVHVGTAHFNLRNGQLSTVFSYDATYVKNSAAFPIEPAFPFSHLTHHCEGIPFSFRDSSPDRWGRNLLNRESLADALNDGIPAIKLDDVDYLVKSSDITREGALRFREPESNEYIASGSNVPPLLQIAHLLRISEEVVADQGGLSAVKELLDVGTSSLGGARPKASMVDNGVLLLAKFPHPHDEWDVMGWEKTAFDLASQCGISVPPNRLISLGGKHSLLSERFDRENGRIDGNRIPYMSGLTLLQAKDGTSCEYVEYAEQLLELASQPDSELKEMLRRICFFIAIHNTDDHMRNWAMLFKRNRWELSPCFDINPDPYGNTQRATSIMGRSGSDEVTGLFELMDYLELDRGCQKQLVDDVLSGIRNWRNVAKHYGIPDHEIHQFAPTINQRCKALRDALNGIL